MHPPIRLVAIDIDGTLLPTFGQKIGERTAQALIAAQEAGITVDPELLGEPFATAPIDFWWAGMHFDQDQTFYAIAMRDAEVSFAGQEALERATIDRHGWLRPEELDGGGERPADPELPRLMRLAVAAILGSA